MNDTVIYCIKNAIRDHGYYHAQVDGWSHFITSVEEGDDTIRVSGYAYNKCSFFEYHNIEMGHYIDDRRMNNESFTFIQRCSR